ncbi:MAG: hypothetical protein WAO72_06310, partial [Syntrophomonadaceae bacterium]
PYAHAVELLADNRGLLTSQPDYHQLAQLMKAILSDPELKTRLQNNARKLGHTISWTQVGRRYSQVLQQIIDNNFQEGKPFHYA